MGEVLVEAVILWARVILSLFSFLFLSTVKCGCKYISPGSTRENRKECSDGVGRYRDHSDLMGPCLKQNTISKGPPDPFTWNERDHIPWAKFQGKQAHVRVCVFS
jgi:hypothetical protein